MKTKNIPNYKKTLFQEIIDEEYLPPGVNEEFCYRIHTNRSILKEALEKIEWIKKYEKSREWNFKILEDLINELAKHYQTERKVNKPFDEE